jgi:hypothetical protein
MKARANSTPVKQVALQRFETSFHKLEDILYNTVLRKGLVSGSVNNCRANG